jgi:hypothetical protein
MFSIIPLCEKPFVDSAHFIVVGASGFEPETSCAQGRRATRLRYAPTWSASLILKHFPTLPPLRSITLSPDCARMGLLYRDCAHCNRHQNISGRRCHFVGSTVELFQGLALHRQFHFGILLEDLLARSGRQANWICRRNTYPARPSLQGHCPNAEEDLRFTQLLTVPFTWRRRDYIGSPSNSPAQACPNKRKAELS